MTNTELCEPEHDTCRPYLTVPQGHSDGSDNHHFDQHTKIYSLPQNPPLFQPNPNNLVKEAKQCRRKYRLVWDKIMENVTPATATFANALLPVLRQGNCHGMSIAGFIEEHGRTNQLRAAAKKARKIMDSIGAGSESQEAAFQTMLEAALAKCTTESLDDEDYWTLVHEIKTRDDEALEWANATARSREIWEELGELESQYRTNLDMIDADRSGLWFTRKELEGVPRAAFREFKAGNGMKIKQMHEAQAKKRRRKKSARGPRGQIKKSKSLQRQYDVSQALWKVLRYAHNEPTRKQAWIFCENKYIVNAPIVQKIVDLRGEEIERCHTYYSSWAASMTVGRMIGDPDKVTAFLDDVIRALRPGKQRNREILLRAKNSARESKGQQPVSDVFAWDQAYYGDATYNDASLEIAKYFPYAATVEKILKLLCELFALVFVPAHSGENRVTASPTGCWDDIVWHDEVLLFGVWNSIDYMNTFENEPRCAFVGFLYVDVFGSGDQYRNKDPHNLTHHELPTIFHELGHAVRKLVNRVKYADNHHDGPDDFAEGPSQLLEHWAWEPEVLHRIASLNSKGESIPASLVEKITGCKQTEMMDHFTWGLVDARFDQEMNGPWKKPETPDKVIDYAEWYNALLEDIGGLKVSEEDAQPENRGHGYVGDPRFVLERSGEHYAYPWAFAYDWDIWKNIFEADPFNKEQGMRYRKLVLEKSTLWNDPWDMLTKFLGRAPSTQTLEMDLRLHQR